MSDKTPREADPHVLNFKTREIECPYRDQVTVLRTALGAIARRGCAYFHLRPVPRRTCNEGVSYGIGSERVQCAPCVAAEALQSPLDNPAISATISPGRDSGERGK